MKLFKSVKVFIAGAAAALAMQAAPASAATVLMQGTENGVLGLYTPYPLPISEVTVFRFYFSEAVDIDAVAWSQVTYATYVDFLLVDINEIFVFFGNLTGTGQKFYQFAASYPQYSGNPASGNYTQYMMAYSPMSELNGFASPTDGAGPFSYKVVAETFSITPEPSTWAAMLMGFGFTGAAMRRRRRSALAA